MQSFLINWHLNCHMREWPTESIAMKSFGCFSREIPAVLFHLAGRSKDLSHVTYNGLEEELRKISNGPNRGGITISYQGEPDLGRQADNEEKAEPVRVLDLLDGDLSPTGSNGSG
jgi:hypothetical protein